MTEEERKKAIDILKRKHLCMNTNCLSVKQLCSECPRDTTNDEVDSAISTALEALKQKPCEDAISRKAVLEYIEHSCADLESNYGNDQVYYAIKAFPTVRPQKKGSWIERFNEEERWLMCTECRQDSDKAHNFCPNCGADMRGEQKNG